MGTDPDSRGDDVPDDASAELEDEAAELLVVCGAVEEEPVTAAASPAVDNPVDGSVVPLLPEAAVVPPAWLPAQGPEVVDRAPDDEPDELPVDGSVAPPSPADPGDADADVDVDGDPDDAVDDEVGDDEVGIDEAPLDAELLLGVVVIDVAPGSVDGTAVLEVGVADVVDVDDAPPSGDAVALPDVPAPAAVVVAEAAAPPAAPLD